MTEITSTARSETTTNYTKDHPSENVMAEFSDELYRKLSQSGMNKNAQLTALHIKQMVEKAADELQAQGQDSSAFTSEAGRTALIQKFERKTKDAQDEGRVVTKQDVAEMIAETAANSTLGNDVIDGYLARLAENAKARDAKQADLVELTSELKLYGIVQSKIQQKISEEQALKPGELNFEPKDFGVKTVEEMKALPAYQKLMEITGKTNNISMSDYLNGIGVDHLDEYSHAKLGKEDHNRQIAALSTSISDKSKVLNDEVTIKVTELNQASSRFNATNEAMSKFIVNLVQLMQQIIRAINS